MMTITLEEWIEKEASHLQNNIETSLSIYFQNESIYDATRTIMTLIRQWCEEKKNQTYLISCPWCGENMEKRTFITQINHLIDCGDRKMK